MGLLRNLGSVARARQILGVAAAAFEISLLLAVLSSIPPVFAVLRGLRENIFALMVWDVLVIVGVFSMLATWAAAAWHVVVDPEVPRVLKLPLVFLLILGTPVAALAYFEFYVRWYRNARRKATPRSSTSAS